MGARACLCLGFRHGITKLDPLFNANVFGTGVECHAGTLATGIFQPGFEGVAQHFASL